MSLLTSPTVSLFCREQGYTPLCLQQESPKIQDFKADKASQFVCRSIYQEPTSSLAVVPDKPLAACLVALGMQDSVASYADCI